MADLTNMSAGDALEQAEKNLAEMRAEENRSELTDMGITDPDTAFELGYETALHDLRRYTSPPSFEVGVATIEIP